MEAYKKYIEKQKQKWQCKGCALFNNIESSKCSSCEKSRVPGENASGPNTRLAPTKTPFSVFNNINGEKKKNQKDCETKMPSSKRQKEDKTQFSFAQKLNEINPGETFLLVFGDNAFGSLGLGSDGPPSVEKPVLMPFSIERRNQKIVFRQIICGSMCTAAIDDRGNVWTWGPNDGGVLGRETSENSESEMLPGKVEFSTTDRELKALKVSIGDEHMASLMDDGSIWSWGSFKDLNGRIGHHVYDGGKLIISQKTPFKMSFSRLTSKRFVDVASGCNHVAVLDEDGKVILFGATNFSKKTCLRSDAPRRKISPRIMHVHPQNVKLKNVFCGSHSVYSIDRNGNLYSGGLNNYGQLGHGDKISFGPKDENKHRFWSSLKQIKFPAEESECKVKKVCAGNHHAIVLKDDNTVWSFGRNASGLLGVVTKEGEEEFKGVIPESLPSSKPLKTKISALDMCSGSDHNLLLTTGGSLVGFGFNSDFRLGLGDEKPVPAGTFKEIVPSEMLKTIQCEIVGMGGGSQFSCVLLEKKNCEGNK